MGPVLGPTHSPKTDMNRRLISLLPFAIALVACGSVGSEKVHPVSLNTAVVLAPGEAAVWSEQAFTVQLVGVIEDSRCPLDTTCVWAGQVKVRLSIRNKSGGSTERDVMEGQGALIEPFRVTVLNVEPKPLATRKISPEEYRVTLKVEPS